MRAIANWLAVTGFFVGLNALAAALFLSLFGLGKLIAPELMEEPIVVVPLGLAVIGITCWVALTSTRRLSRARARA